MNKKINLWLNVSESVLLFIIMVVSTILYVSNFQPNVLGTNLIIIGFFILEIALISVELFMFYIEKKKYRFFTILYYFLALIILMITNIFFPFFGLFILFIFNIGKSFFRIKRIENICNLDQYYEFCDTFHIKVKKKRGRRATKTSNVKKTNTQSSKTKVVATKNKKETTAKKTAKSYA